MSKQQVNQSEQQVNQSQEFCSLNVDVRSLAENIDRLAAMKNWMNLQSQFLDQHIQRSASQMNTIIAMQQLKAVPNAARPVVSNGSTLSSNQINLGAPWVTTAIPSGVNVGMPNFLGDYNFSSMPFVAASPFHSTAYPTTSAHKVQQWIDTAQQQIGQVMAGLQASVNGFTGANEINQFASERVAAN